MSVPDKIANARRLKDEGNDLFKQKNFKKARVRYATALAYTKGLPGRELPAGSDPMVAGLTGQQNSADKLSPEVNQEVTDLEAVLHTNIATCFLKLDKAEEALEAAEKATAVSSTYAKAWLRKAEAHLQSKSKNTEKAFVALDRAESLANGDQGILSTVNTLRTNAKKEERLQNQKQAKAFGNIFQRMHKDEGQER